MQPQQQMGGSSFGAQLPQAQQQQKPGGLSGFIGSLFGSISGKKPEPTKAKESKAEFYEMERNLSCNEVDSDDLDGDLNLSDSEDG